MSLGSLTSSNNLHINNNNNNKTPILNDKDSNSCPPQTDHLDTSHPVTSVASVTSCLRAADSLTKNPTLTTPVLVVPPLSLVSPCGSVELLRDVLDLLKHLTALQATYHLHLTYLTYHTLPSHSTFPTSPLLLRYRHLYEAIRPPQWASLFSVSDSDKASTHTHSHTHTNTTSQSDQNHDRADEVMVSGPGSSDMESLEKLYDHCVDLFPTHNHHLVLPTSPSSSSSAAAASSLTSDHPSVTTATLTTEITSGSTSNPTGGALSDDSNPSIIPMEPVEPVESIKSIKTPFNTPISTISSIQSPSSSPIHINWEQMLAESKKPRPILTTPGVIKMDIDHVKSSGSGGAKDNGNMNNNSRVGRASRSKLKTLAKVKRTLITP